MLKRAFFIAGRLLSYICPDNIYHKLQGLFEYLYTGWITRGMKRIGKNSKFGIGIHLVGASSIEIEENVYIGHNSSLTAFSVNEECKISIGKGSMLGNYNHITSCNRVKIGSNVRTGNYVLITDNSHGDLTDTRQMSRHPNERPLYSKGEVIIGDNVWIGEKVSIMPGVKIGNKVVIGANSVVTHSCDDNCIIAGIPARVLKKI